MNLSIVQQWPAQAGFLLPAKLTRSVPAPHNPSIFI
jgi:hypothetical protein